MNLIEWLPYICGFILLLALAWWMIDSALDWLAMRQELATPKKTEDQPSTITYVQPGDEGQKIPGDHAE